MDPSSSFRVLVRLRPPNESEIEKKRSLFKLDDTILVFDPSSSHGTDNVDTAVENVGSKGGRDRRGKARTTRGLSRKAKDFRLAFDYVFGEEQGQDEVFQKSTMSLVSSLFDGYSSTVFCYGATGAGKTYTMMGNRHEPGVMVKTLEAIFTQLSEREATLGVESEVTISYLEIYNERIHDLLVPHLRENGSSAQPRNLQLRDDRKKGMVVAGLSEHHPQSAEEVLDLISTGNERRSQAPTDLNNESSRSHAILQITVTSSSNSRAVSESVSIGKMMLIDLAGSERAAASTNRGARMVEGANINKSLLALGNCIHALTAPGTKKSGTFVPYRNSKLTRLLKDALGGRSQSVMIANVSPSVCSYEDTYNTLKYASRAKDIKTAATRQVVDVDRNIAEYKTIIDSLRNQVTHLQEQLRIAQTAKCPHCQKCLTDSAPPCATTTTSTKMTVARLGSPMRQVSEADVQPPVVIPSIAPAAPKLVARRATAARLFSTISQSPMKALKRKRPEESAVGSDLSLKMQESSPPKRTRTQATRRTRAAAKLLLSEPEPEIENTPPRPVVTSVKRSFGNEISELTDLLARVAASSPAVQKPAIGKRTWGKNLEKELERVSRVLNERSR